MSFVSVDFKYHLDQVKEISPICYLSTGHGVVELEFGDRLALRDAPWWLLTRDVGGVGRHGC